MRFTQNSPSLQSLTQKKSNFASEKAKLSCLAGLLSFALPQAKLLFFCVKDCNTGQKIREDIVNSRNMSHVLGKSADFGYLSVGLRVVQGDVVGLVGLY